MPAVSTNPVTCHRPFAHGPSQSGSNPGFCRQARPVRSSFSPPNAIHTSTFSSQKHGNLLVSCCAVPTGDAVEVTDWVTGEQTLIPLAGPANRQGRIAADNIAGRSSRFRGTQGTAVVGLFGMTLASTGEEGGGGGGRRGKEGGGGRAIPSSSCPRILCAPSSAVAAAMSAGCCRAPPDVNCKESAVFEAPLTHVLYPALQCGASPQPAHAKEASMLIQMGRTASSCGAVHGLTAGCMGCCMMYGTAQVPARRR